MESLWIVLGILVLAATLLDIFLTVFNYDEAGLFVHRIVRWEWLVLRAVTRRIRRRWRPVALRQVTGLLILATILWWVSGIILGFSFIYYGAMLIDDGFQISTGVSRDYLGALYLSVGQFATVGVDNISPGGALLDLLTVSEAMVNVLVLSFIIAFLSNVYGVVQSLRALSSNFFRAGHGVVAPIDTLVAYFPDGEARGLDSQLGSIADGLSAYSDGISQNPVAYYFQSGRDQFSLPFSLFMTAGVIGALRWGVPTGTDATKEPQLTRLTELFEDLRVSLLRMLHREAPKTPAPVSADEFAAAVAAFDLPGPKARLDPWVLRFLIVDRRAAALVGSTVPIDPEDGYRRYTQWLQFDYQAQWLLAVVSRDLDYQPVYRGTAATPDGVPLDDGYADVDLPLAPGPRVPVVTAPKTQDAERGPSRPLRWLRRRQLFIDPGYVRLADALRTLTAVALALAVVLPLAQLVGVAPETAAVFSGMVALFSTPAAGAAPPAGKRLRRAVISLIPLTLAIVVGALVPREPAVIIIAMALVAGFAVWLRRFGPRMGGLAQMGFLIFYFSLLVALEPGEILPALGAAFVGLLASTVVQAIPGPKAERQVDSGILALYERLSDLVDTAIDLVATGRRDRRLVGSLRSARTALERTVDRINGPLDRLTSAQMSQERVRVLRMRVFDVQLAAENLLTLLPVVSSISITVEERARLAGDLVAMNQELATYRGTVGPPERSRSDAALPADLTADVRRILFAILRLGYAAERLRRVQLADDKAVAALLREEETARPDRDETTTAPDAATGGATGAAGAAERGGLLPTDRQAAQASLATGLALFLGSLVSTSHQYWAAMPAFQVISGSDGETRLKSIQRILATVVASGIAFGLAIVAGHSPWWAFPLLIVSVFFVAFSRSVSPAGIAFWITLLLATMYDVLGTLTVETVQVRLIETAVGGVVAIVISAIVLPTRTGTKVLQGMSHTVAEAESLLPDLVAPAVGGTPLGARELADRERALAQLLTQLENQAKPLRRNPGSLRADGIEAQLTALWSMLNYERALGRTMSRVTPAPGGPDWARLTLSTQENFQAARDVLAGTLPKRLHPLGEFDVDPGDGTGAQTAAITQLTRLNQSLLALIEAVRPGTVDPPDPAPADPPHARRRARSRA